MRIRFYTGHKTDDPYDDWTVVIVGDVVRTASLAGSGILDIFRDGFDEDADLAITLAEGYEAIPDNKDILVLREGLA